MEMQEFVMNHPQDHIMANTWRLIFERQLQQAVPQQSPKPMPDFGLLEQLLPEYRMIGLSLADTEQKRRVN